MNRFSVKNHFVGGKIFLVILGVIVLCGLTNSVHALVSLDSLILGSVAQNYVEKVNNPVENIFKQIFSNTEHLKEREQLSLYRTHIDEGRNLNERCRFNGEIYYQDQWKHDQAMRSMFATLQYIGLDLSVSAIVQYAKYFEWSKEDFEKLSNNIVTKYCSKNVSVISLKELRNNFLYQWDGNPLAKIPSVEENPLFPEVLKKNTGPREVRELEFKQSLKLFRTFCSWGGDIDYPRLMSVLLRDPTTMAMIIRRMVGEKLVYAGAKGSAEIVHDPTSSISVLCDNLICRKVPYPVFKERFSKSVGFVDIKQDLERLYCREVRDIDDKARTEPSSVVKEWLKQETVDDYNFTIGHFNSLVTGIPDFFLWAKKYQDMVGVFRSGLDQYWTDWANHQMKNLSGDIYFEETLNLELVDRKFYFNDRIPKFAVHLDINAGEIDRTTSIRGKISASFKLKFKKSFLNWIRSEWTERETKKVSKTKHLIGVMKKHVEDSVDAAREKFKYPPWSGDLAGLLSREILNQLEEYKGNYFKKSPHVEVEIPVYFNYGNYALKHFYYESNIQKERKRLDYTTYEYSD